MPKSPKKHTGAAGKRKQKRTIFRSGNIELTRASAIKPEHTRWAWDGYVPLKELTILAGLGGVGKSTLLAELAARLTNGTLEGDLDGKRVGVVMASAEDVPSGTLWPRLTAAGADLDRVFIETMSTDDSTDGISLPDDIDDLAATISRTNARVVMLDPLPSFLGGGIDDSSNTQTWRALKPIVRMARELNIAVIGLTHLNKRAEATSVSRVIGSVAYRNVPRSSLLLGAEADNPKRLHLIHTKCNFGTADPLACHVEEEYVKLKGEKERFKTSRFYFDGVSTASEHDVLSAPGSSDDLSLKDEAAVWLESTLSEGPIASGDLYRKAETEVGCSGKTLRRAKEAIGAKARQVDKGGWVWELPGRGKDE